MKHCNKKQLAVELVDWETTAKLQIAIPDVKCQGLPAALRNIDSLTDDVDSIEMDDNPPMEYWLLRRH